MMPGIAETLVGSSPGRTFGEKLGIAGLRALRTFLQGVAAAFGTGAAGAEILSTGYWETFGVSVLGAVITAIASFIQNAASFLPEDPTQKTPT
jgi:hypothetical protein